MEKVLNELMEKKGLKKPLPDLKIDESEDSSEYDSSRPNSAIAQAEKELNSNVKRGSDASLSRFPKSLMK